MRTNIYKKNMHWFTLGALALGILVGTLFPRLGTGLAFLGDIYIGLLKLVIVPLLMCQVFAVAASDGKNAGKTLGKTLVLFFVLFVSTFLLSFLLLSLLRPGEGYVFDSSSWEGTIADTTAESVIANLFCWNIFEAMASTKIFPCVLFSLICGIAAMCLKMKRAAEVAGNLAAIFVKILDWIMYLTPLGVFALMAESAAVNGTAIIGMSLKYILCAWGLSIVAMFVVMFLPLRIFKKVKGKDYLKAMLRVWGVSLSTCSSTATLPTTMQVCEEEFGVSEEVTSIVVPLGCTIHMCGGAVSFCLLALFTMQASGIVLTPVTFIELLLLATMLNMAAPGIPGGGIALGAAYLTAMGLPLDFMGVYSGIYRFLDMIYTTLNVSGDVTANVLLSGNDTKKDL